MPAVLKGRRAGLALPEARSKAFFHQILDASHLRAVIGTPGAASFVGKANKFSNIAINYPDPYVALMMSDGVGVQPRFVGAYGELFADIYAGVNPAGLGAGTLGAAIGSGALRHVGGGHYSTLLVNPAYPEICGVITFAPDWTYSVPLMFNAFSLTVNVHSLGEFAPGVFRFLVAVAIRGPAGSVVPVIYMFSTDALGPGAGTQLTLPVPVEPRASFIGNIGPLGRGRAIYMQGYGTSFNDEIEPQIMRIENWTEVSVVGTLSDIDPDWGVIDDALFVNATRAWFVKVGPTHIVFAYDRIFNLTLGAAFHRPRMFLSSNDGASWANLALPAGVVNSFYDEEPSLAQLPITCFGVGCFGFAHQPSLIISGFDYWYTLDYGASWKLLPLNGLPPGLFYIGRSDIFYKLIVLRPYVDASDKGELAFMHVDLSGVGNQKRSLYVTTDLGANWSYRSLIIDIPGVDFVAERFNDLLTFVGEPLLKKAPILTGLPGALEL